MAKKKRMNMENQEAGTALEDVETLKQQLADALKRAEEAEKVLQVSETEITDSNQILSKENALFFDLWEFREEADGLESE